MRCPDPGIRRTALLLLWHYERDNGRSTRKEDYVGRVDSEKAKADLVRRMAAYHRNAGQEFARKRARIERLIAANHTST